MKKISILISPQIKSAYFAEFIECSLKEINYCMPHLETKYKEVGPLHFIDTVATKEQMAQILRLSFVQGIFERTADSQLIPIDKIASFHLHDNFIFGSKFKGKTNEHFTQMMINIGISSIEKNTKIKILDPMCGRATTLLWALRYGMTTKGIEVDPKALADIKQIVKKWSKICKISTKLNDGYVSKKTKSQEGKFLECKTDHASFKVITGNSVNAKDYLSNEKFDLVISDIPYGIQHLSNNGAKDPLGTLEKCLPAWAQCLTNEGSIVIGYNANNPKTDKLIELAKSCGLEALDFSIAHRMSESIVRDVIILKK